MTTMENQLSFVLKLSLEEMALRRVVANLWNDADILDSIMALNMDPMQYKVNNNWQDIVENNVKARVSKLVIPKSLKKRMKLIVRPIGLQIKHWKSYLEAYLSNSRKCLSMHFFEQLCWTSAGSIDYQQTAANIVRLKTIDVVTRYKLACLFCVADSILDLWEELPQDYKRRFNDQIDVEEFNELILEFYWSYVLKAEESKLDSMLKRFYPDYRFSFYQYAFGRSADIANKAATEYFFQNLTCKERDDCLIRTVSAVVKQPTVIHIKYLPNLPLDQYKFRERNFSDVLCYLLSLMSPEQQMEFFKTHAIEALPFFLDWPWQDLFLTVADLVWTIFQGDYFDLTHRIQQNLENKIFCCPNLIKNFFQRSPRSFRMSFLWTFLSWFSEFSDAGDEEFIKATFRDIDPEAKAGQFAYGYRFYNTLRVLIRKDKWSLVELWIRELSVLKEDRERVKETIERYLLSDLKGEELKQVKSRLKNCFEMLEETEASVSNKRSSDMNH